jgi:hypothetical protein
MATHNRRKAGQLLVLLFVSRSLGCRTIIIAFSQSLVVLLQLGPLREKRRGRRRGSVRCRGGPGCWESADLTSASFAIHSWRACHGRRRKSGKLMLFLRYTGQPRRGLYLMARIRNQELEDGLTPGEPVRLSGRVCTGDGLNAIDLSCVLKVES